MNWVIIRAAGSIEICAVMCSISTQQISTMSKAHDQGSQLSENTMCMIQGSLLAHGILMRFCCPTVKSDQHATRNAGSENELKLG